VKVLAGFSVALTIVLAYAASVPWRVVVTTPRSWPMAVEEQAAYDANELRAQNLVDQLAAITSDLELRRRIVFAISNNTAVGMRQIQAAERAASARIGVAVVASGSSWVPAGR
jgi:hypothetical protein